jgi:hypothetical protein
MERGRGKGFWNRGKEEIRAHYGRKIMGLIVICAMMINGFGSSMGEGKRYSAIMMSVGVAGEMVKGILGKCNENLAEVSRGVVGYIVEKIKGEEGEERGVGGEKKRGEESGAGEGNCVIEKVGERRVEGDAGEKGRREERREEYKLGGEYKVLGVRDKGIIIGTVIILIMMGKVHRKAGEGLSEGALFVREKGKGNRKTKISA